MSNAIERLVSLAIFFADARGTVTAEQARTQVAGYPADQDEIAFIRMFERDKDDLRRAGLTIISDDVGNYRLDTTATFSAPIDLSPGEAAAVEVAGSALVADPSFPYAGDLRLALAKIAQEFAERVPGTAARLADEDPDGQGRAVAALSAACTAGKRVMFDYTNSGGTRRTRAVEPYGLFLHDGRWYLVGRDTDADALRTFTVSRMEGLSANSAAPRTRDFERPEDFDVATFVRLPFQYGLASDAFEATLRFDSRAAWRAKALCAGQGVLTSDGDGALWTIEARSVPRILRFVIENGPGISIVYPPGIALDLAEGLAHVEALHG